MFATGHWNYFSIRIGCLLEVVRAEAVGMAAEATSHSSSHSIYFTTATTAQESD